MSNQVLPFTYAADFRTGYNRTIVLLPHNAGTYEYGVDKDGGWSESGGFIQPIAANAANLKTALYASRFGFANYPTDGATLKEVGVDAKLGDRITVTPNGGAPILLVLKPETSLVSAVQYGNGQVNIFGDYRRIGTLLYPFRVTQGADVTKMAAYQASKVELLEGAPDTVAVTRPPHLPTATPAPVKAAPASPRPSAKPHS